MSNEFKLVPVEPTDEMIMAFITKKSSGYADEYPSVRFGGNYRAMLAAAPKPPALGGEPETAAWLDLKKLKIGDMAYATRMKVNHRQTELIDRAHLAPLQAEIKRQNLQLESFGEDVGQLKSEVEDLESERDQLKARCDELEKDAALMDYLQDQLVDTIYLDDGRIIDIAGRMTVREGVHAHMSKPAGSEQASCNNEREDLGVPLNTPCKACGRGPCIDR